VLLFEVVVDEKGKMVRRMEEMVVRAMIPLVPSSWRNLVRYPIAIPSSGAEIVALDSARFADRGKTTRRRSGL
jgi:hypothetical protein